jgi:branched-chain amino acid transport system ATP-binding protein
MALLEISKVSLSFSGLRALIDVSFDVAEGEIVGLIGPNGAGKSTLLNCISCLYRPESGQIGFDGRDLANCKSHQVAALGIRRTFQNLELFREASVRENVTLGLAYRYR